MAQENEEQQENQQEINFNETELQAILNMIIDEGLAYMTKQELMALTIEDIRKMKIKVLEDGRILFDNYENERLAQILKNSRTIKDYVFHTNSYNKALNEAKNKAPQQAENEHPEQKNKEVMITNPEGPEIQSPEGFKERNIYFDEGMFKKNKNLRPPMPDISGNIKANLLKNALISKLKPNRKFFVKDQIKPSKSPMRVNKPNQERRFQQPKRQQGQPQKQNKPGQNLAQQQQQRPPQPQAQQQQSSSKFEQAPLQKNQPVTARLNEKKKKGSFLKGLGGPGIAIAGLGLPTGLIVISRFV